jgi:hypothetical protein
MGEGVLKRARSGLEFRMVAVCFTFLAVAEKKLATTKGTKVHKGRTLQPAKRETPVSEPLFVAQDDYRVDFRGSPGGDVARGERHQREQHGHSGEGQ